MAKKEAEWEELVARTRLMLQRAATEQAESKGIDLGRQWEQTLSALLRFRSHKALTLGDRPTFKALIFEAAARDPELLRRRLYELMQPYESFLSADSALELPLTAPGVTLLTREAPLPFVIASSTIDEMPVEHLISFGYLAILGREVDPEGRSYFEDSIRGGEMGRYQFLYILQSGQEALNRGAVFRPFIVGLDDPAELPDVLNAVLTALLCGFESASD
ncbi:hypothetical protein SAMN04488038_102243 [Solimonas aquatica]|uniref:DUF4214 domain-containing protein n=1 Tax=Solimonas aquatica TaxID=489703 RepID=A0A1H9BWJ7_9GAMM|nr:DUF4214 domain-containing protein [Solimonas aquatica]SEP92933.1 hypothetical protein SAMN04488038_102243 [Solimonas aquatica]